MIWVIVLIAAIFRHKCCKKKMKRLFRKLVKLENKDNNGCYMILSRGINEIEFHIKLDNIN